MSPSRDEVSRKIMISSGRRASEERHATELVADVHSIGVAFGAAVRDDDRNVLERVLELGRQIVER